MGNNWISQTPTKIDSVEELIDAVSKLQPDVSDGNYKVERGLIREISEKLRNNERQTRVLIESVIELVSTTLPVETMQLALVNTTNLLSASRGILYFWEKEGNFFDRMHSSVDEGNFTGGDLKIVDEIARHVHSSNELILNPKLDLIPVTSEIPEHKDFSDLSIIAAPISIEVEGKIDSIGVIYLDAKTKDKAFTVYDLWTLRLFASLTALSIRNIRITGTLRLAYRDTIYALVNALEAKDPYTKGHSDRVAEYSERCGKHMRLGMVRLGILYSAALLHDIGKIGIRENVLNKPSKLTSDEYNHIKKHPEISEAILHGLDFLREENKILKQHHERFDGKGYPNGLKGDEISLEGAIIQVADAWDAMTSRRIYRKELDLEYALNELKNNAGTQFNPIIVKAFIEMIEEEGVVDVYDYRTND